MQIQTGSHRMGQALPQSHAGSGRRIGNSPDLRSRRFRKRIHARIKVGDTTVMASDCNCTGKPNFQGVSLSLIARSDAEAERVFTALSEGGKVNQPLSKTFFSSSFGVVSDRFGVSWMVVVMP